MFKNNKNNKNIKQMPNSARAIFINAEKYPPLKDNSIASL